MYKYENYSKQKFKISKWWLFKVKLFGKKTYEKDCDAFSCVETFGVKYKGILMIYKVKRTPTMRFK